MSELGERRPLPKGLHFVATPLGNARDITLRALDTLRDADVLAAEDTRSLRRLMEMHGVPLAGRRVIAYHDHNGPVARPPLLAALNEGKTVAYASEAGSPLIADPGFALARAAREAGHDVHAVPGPSAVVTALTVAGLPTDRFAFGGFAPASGAARRKFLGEFRDFAGTLVFYESPRRLGGFLDDALASLGPREASICRELTKKFEEVHRGELASLSAHYADHTVKGEVVVCIAGRGEDEVSKEAIERALREARETMSLKAAAAAVSEALGVPKREAYQLGLAMDRGD